MTTHDSKRLKMSSIQYAWGRLPSCIFHDQFQVSSDVSKTREPNLSYTEYTLQCNMSHSQKLPVDPVLCSQDIENVDVNVRVAPCEESDHPVAPIMTPKNAESPESKVAFVITPKPREVTFEHLKASSMKCLACRHNRVVFVNDIGQILVYKGSNNTTNVMTKTQCGIGSTKLCKHIELAESLSAHTITSISCGEHHTAALTSTGQMWSWGDNTYGQLGQDPEIVKHSESPVKLSHTSLGDALIVQIASGANFNIILTDTGDLYSWGVNNKGQLGFRTKCEFQWSPQHLSSLRGLCIVQITCGESHSLCLTTSGSLFGWGWNKYGQLGVGTTNDAQWPKKLKSLENQRITTIACGDTHSVALSKDGKIYTFGNGEHGQLGHNSTKNETLPKIVMDLMGDNVTHVACGRAHTIINIRSTTGETYYLYSFGSGSYGQLGHGDLSDRIQPVRVAGISTNGNLTELITNGTLVVDTLITGGDQSYVRFGCKSEVDHQIVNSRPLLLTEQIIQNYSDDLERWKLKKIISSVNCLNGSFLTGDKHYSSTTEYCGIDLQLAEDIFTKLDEMPNVSLRNELTELISKQLIPSLDDDPPDIEAMRLYLTLPLTPPFQDPTNIGAILGPFARRVRELRKYPSKIYNKWWASMPRRNFRWFKNIYHEAVTYMIHYPGEVAADITLTTAREYLVCCMELLKRLYEINETREKSILFSEFYMSGLNEKVDIFTDVAAKIGMDNGKIEKQFVMCNYPFLFDMTAKSKIRKAISGTLQQFAMNKANQAIIEHNRAVLTSPYRPLPPPANFVLPVRRYNLVISSMTQLGTDIRNGQDLRRPLLVVFDDERIAGGGPTKEFFLLLQEQLLSPEYDIFEEDEKSHLIWFKSEPQSEKWNMVVRALNVNGQSAYTVLGALCSLAIYNNVVMDFHFPSALYKKILHKPLVLEDLKELHPNYESFTDLLEMPEDEVEDVCFYFQINVTSNGQLKPIDLIPDGSQTQVNAENRKEFVDKTVDYILNKSVEEMFEEFRLGFISVFAQKYLRLFHPKEIQELISGNTEYNWDTFKELCAYERGYHSDHETIKYFWEVFMAFEEEEKKRFLLFLTGSRRIPIEGMKAVSMTIDTLTENENFLPSTETCFSRLHLPVYKSKEKLKEKLTMAICVIGFGKS